MSNALLLLNAGVSGRRGIGPLTVEAGDQSFSFSWPAADVEPDEWIIWFNITNNYSTAIKLYAGGTVTGAETSKTIASTNNANITPLAAGTLITGTKYYFWLTKGDGSGNAVGLQSPVKTGRALITLGSGFANGKDLRVPYDLGTPSASGGSVILQDLIFGSTLPPSSTILSKSGTDYEYFPGFGWFEMVTVEPADNVVISGAFFIQQDSSSSFTFWNTAPS